MAQRMSAPGLPRLPEVGPNQGSDRISTNTTKRVRRSLPWGAKEKWHDTLRAIASSALVRNIVAMSAECTTDDGRYAFADELMAEVDRKLQASGKPPLFRDRFLSFKREVSEADIAVSEVLMHPNCPVTREKAREELSEAKCAVARIEEAL